MAVQADSKLNQKVSKMSTTVKEKAGEFQQVSVGIFPAICYSVIDIGAQDGPFGIKEQLVISFEFPTEQIMIDGKNQPMIMSAFYGATLGKKARLKSDLEGWRGRSFTADELNGFELKNVIGKACTITTFSNEDGKTRIKAIGPAMKGQDHKQHNESVWFDLDVHGVNSPDFQRVPEWLRKMIDSRIITKIEPQQFDERNPPPIDDFDDLDSVPF